MGIFRRLLFQCSLLPLCFLLTKMPGTAPDHSDAALRIPVYAYKNADRYLLDTRMNLSAACGEHVVVKDVQYLEDGDTVFLDANNDFSLHVIHTPGHTPDSVAYYSEKDSVAFVGDTIFKGSVGNYRYPGGNAKDLENSIINKIFCLPDQTVLCSGHSGQTTVGEERRRYSVRFFQSFLSDKTG